MELLAGNLESLETRALRDGDSQTSQGTWLDRVFQGPQPSEWVSVFYQLLQGSLAFQSRPQGARLSKEAGLRRRLSGRTP